MLEESKNQIILRLYCDTGKVLDTISVCSELAVFVATYTVKAISSTSLLKSVYFESKFVKATM